MKKIIGIDIGGTKCAVILGESLQTDINILDKVAFPTETSLGSDYAINKIFESIEMILGRNNIGAADLKCMGISCGGPLDSRKGVIMSPPNLPGWDNIPITKMLRDRYGVPVSLQNDANACALAEWKFGAAQGYRNVIFLTFGTGMGAGLILDGRLYSGTSDMAGEVGHMRLDVNGPVGYGKAGSFEGFCSGGGIAQLAQTKVLEKLQVGEKPDFCDSMDKLSGLNAKIVGDAAAAGDELAREIYSICGRHLGQGLSLLIDILNPEVIVIGSIFARSEELLRASAQEVINRETLSYSRNVCKIVPAGLGEKIGDYASLAVAAY